MKTRSQTKLTVLFHEAFVIIAFTLMDIRGTMRMWAMNAEAVSRLSICTSKSERLERDRETLRDGNQVAMQFWHRESSKINLPSAIFAGASLQERAVQMKRDSQLWQFPIPSQSNEHHDHGLAQSLATKTSSYFAFPYLACQHIRVSIQNGHRQFLGTQG